MSYDFCISCADVPVTPTGIQTPLMSPTLPHHKYSYDYPDVRFLGDPLLETVDSAGHCLSWPEVGITVNVPPKAVPTGKAMHIMVWPSLNGPFSLPQDYKLASPVYFISHDSSFLENVNLSVAHFAGLSNEEDCQKMVFLASDKEKDSEDKYRFVELRESSHFIPNTFNGQIWLKEFNVIAVGQKRLQQMEKETTREVSTEGKLSIALTTEYP